jgi:hypothetical protein
VGLGPVVGDWTPADASGSIDFSLRKSARVAELQSVELRGTTAVILVPPARQLTMSRLLFLPMLLSLPFLTAGRWIHSDFVPAAAASDRLGADADVDSILTNAILAGDTLIQTIERQQQSGRWLWFDPVTQDALKRETTHLRQAQAGLHGWRRAAGPTSWRSAWDELKTWQETYFMALATLREPRAQDATALHGDVLTARRNAQRLETLAATAPSWLAEDLRANAGEIEALCASISMDAARAAQLSGGDWLDLRQELEDRLAAAREAYWQSLARADGARI